jgi:hypothetical protein
LYQTKNNKRSEKREKDMAEDVVEDKAEVKMVKKWRRKWKWKWKWRDKYDMQPGTSSQKARSLQGNGRRAVDDTQAEKPQDGGINHLL